MACPFVAGEGRERKQDQNPMNMADFGTWQKSSQTPCNFTYILANAFLTVLGLVHSDFG